MQLGGIFGQVSLIFNRQARQQGAFGFVWCNGISQVQQFLGQIFDCRGRIQDSHLAGSLGQLESRDRRRDRGFQLGYDAVGLGNQVLGLFNVGAGQLVVGAMIDNDVVLPFGIQSNVSMAGLFAGSSQDVAGLDPVA